jgi:hypothetical protein
VFRDEWEVCIYYKISNRRLDTDNGNGAKYYYIGRRSELRRSWDGVDVVVLVTGGTWLQ